MELIYILSSAHSGSTILDLTLGTNPNFCSSGEQRYLPWQLERTATTGGSLEQESICTCLNSFRDCKFWSEVFKKIEAKTGINISESPRDFPISFFGKFAYRDRGSFLQKVTGKLTRHSLQLDLLPKHLLSASKNIKTILNNNWILYESMAEVAKTPFVVDSSKDITRALLLHKSRPEKIVFLFLSRNLYGYVNSMMKHGLSMEEAIRRRDNYLEMVNQVKTHVRRLRYYETTYETFINNPISFLQSLSKFLDTSLAIDEKMKRGTLDTRTMHLVAGNPTRYRGEMQLQLDNKWQDSLSKKQIQKINSLSKFP